MTGADQLDSRDLIGRLALDDWRTVVEAARSLAKRGAQEAIPALLDVLDSTNDPRVWNAAAIALADMRAPDAQGHIVALLRDAKTVGSRGSLLYALEDGFDFREEAPLLAQMSVSGNFEVRAACARMLIAIEGDLTDQLRGEVSTILRVALPSASADVRAELGRLAEVFGASADSADTNKL